MSIGHREEFRVLTIQALLQSGLALALLQRGLTLEISALEPLYGEQITLSTLFKPNICCIYHTLTLWAQGSPLVMTGAI